MQTDYTPCQPMLGIIPRSRLGRIVLAWAALNIVLTVLPLLAGIGNGSRMVAGILPLTILYSYAVFCSNCLLGLAFYLCRARGWAEREDRGAVQAPGLDRAEASQ
ncbi:hypothetical protein V8Z80_01850 [Orrella sp. JC864]|uniref:hypothetical protein n=1 Tax=Orrella sp. JC864 TaxID=3120298 RepID=UPI00300942F4